MADSIIPFDRLGITPVIPKMYWDVYSDEERVKELCKAVDGIYKYAATLGNYYVPTYGGVWSSSKTYKPNTLVKDSDNNSWLSLKQVPSGQELVEGEYWVEVYQYDAQVKDLQTSVSTITPFDSTPTSGSSKGVTSGGVYNAINANETDFIVFGDSWSDSSVSTWVSTFSNISRMTAHNYAVNGATMTSITTNNLQAQVNNFISDNINPNKIAFVIIVGGINDKKNHSISATNLRSALIEQTNIIKKHINIKTPVYYTYNYEWPYKLADITYWKFVCLGANVPYIPLSTYGCFSSTEFNSANWYHLTSNANNFYANIIYNLIYGNAAYTPYTLKSTNHYTTDTEDISIVQVVSINYNNSTIFETYLLLINKAPANYHTNITLDTANAIIIPGNNLLGGIGSMYTSAVLETSSNTKIAISLNNTNAITTLTTVWLTCALYF